MSMIPKEKNLLEEIVELAVARGSMTYDEINERLPEGITPDEMGQLLEKLESLDINVLERSAIPRSDPSMTGPQSAPLVQLPGEAPAREESDLEPAKVHDPVRNDWRRVE